MEQKISGVMISAVKSGSGKTTFTCALLEVLKKRGMNPCAFKCGPDYIDPMFHRKVLEVLPHNLDSFFCNEEQLCRIYAESMNNGKNKKIAVVEGAMGLFDGIGGINEEGSAYHTACILQLPILLVADAHGMGRSILALLSGFCKYDREKRIAGVILNKISDRFYNSIAPMIEEELQLPVLGFLPQKQEFLMESRHLGLKLPDEVLNIQNRIEIMSRILEENISVNKIIEIADKQTGKVQWMPSCDGVRKKCVRIGVAMDEAFCFYYEENLRLLEQEGAELIYFSPLHDKELPKGLDGILIGGGYPEIYAAQLEQNISMRTSIKQAVGNGMPSVAECGGFMYLHESIEDDKGNIYKMCGVLPQKCFYAGQLVRFGYIELKEKKNNFLRASASIKGHEFHYYDSFENGEDCVAKKPVTEKSWECVFDRDNHFWGFPHLYYPSNPDFAAHFIKKAKSFRNRAECASR